MGKYLVLGILCAAACATSPEQRSAEREHAQRCARIEMYPLGVTPSRPFRVLGPLSVSSDGNPSRRDRSLQDRACQLDADAVIDVHDESAAQGVQLSTQSAQTDSVTSSGTAVAYVEDKRPQ